MLYLLHLASNYNNNVTIGSSEISLVNESQVTVGGESFSPKKIKPSIDSSDFDQDQRHRTFLQSLNYTIASHDNLFQFS